MYYTEAPWWQRQDDKGPRGHVVRNPVEAAYARSDLFERRRLMNHWAVYVAGAHRRQPPIAEPAEQEIAASAAP